MKQFISFIKKEFHHILRDKRTMIIMLIIPIVLLLILGFAISNEIKNTPFVVFDQSKTEMSRKFIDKINANRFFNLINNINNSQEIEDYFRKGKCKVAIIIPSSFADDLYKIKKMDIQLIIDSSDPAEATNISNYLQSIIMLYQQDLLQPMEQKYLIDSEIRFLYNPQAKSAYSFVPGLTGTILLLVCAMMTSISIVREKETGTMELLLVSPLKARNIILAKAIPYFALSMMNVGSIMFISYFILDVPMAGSFALVLFLCIVFTFSALSLGLLISSITHTQQSAIIASALGLMLPSIILSGLIFPLESTPYLLQFISNFIPAKWFIEALRAIMIKGLGITSIWKELLVLLLMTIVSLAASIKMFKKQL